MLKKISTLIACLGIVGFTSNTVIAATNDINHKVKACVQYQRADGSWGKNYSVKGYLVKGDRVNKWFSDRGEFTQYNDNNFYYFINWKRGNKTVIDLGQKRMLPQAFSITKDQDDRVWMIKKDFCKY